MAIITFKWNGTVDSDSVVCWTEGDNKICSASIVAEVNSVLISLVIAILVIVTISLIVVMGGALATAKIIREERRNKQHEHDERCSNSNSRKSSATQYDVGNTHEQQFKPPPAFKTSIPGISDFAETRSRAATSPDIFSADGKRTSFNSNRGSRHSRFGLKLSRKNSVQEKQEYEKKKKKDRILMNHPTPTGLLQNMRVINYELTGKGNFLPPPDKKKNGSENSDEHPLVPMSSDVSSPEGELSIKSNAKGNPVYYTLETEDETAYDDVPNPLNSTKEDKSSSASSSIPNHVEQHFSSRSMSDTLDAKSKKKSFRLMSEGNGSKNAYSATLDPKHFSSKIRSGHHRSGSVDQGYLKRSSQVYEDVGHNDNDSVQSYSGTGEYHSYSQLETMDKPDSYCLLSRSLEDGLGGYKEWVDLPGYQKLQVGSPMDDDYDLSVGVAV